MISLQYPTGCPVLGHKHPFSTRKHLQTIKLRYELTINGSTRLSKVQIKRLTLVAEEGFTSSPLSMKISSDIIPETQTHRCGSLYN